MAAFYPQERYLAPFVCLCQQLGMWPDVNAASEIRSIPPGAESVALAVVDSIERIRQRSEDLDRAWYDSLGLQGNAGRVVLRLLVLGPATASELSRHINITSAGMTSLIDRLEATLLVVRRKHPTDRRRMLVYPSKRLQSSFLQRNTHRAAILYAAQPSTGALTQAQQILDGLVNALADV